jgi:hypothetical protein
MTTESVTDRRQFSRIPFHISAELIDKEQQSTHVEVIDISLHGLLVDKPADWSGQLKQHYQAKLKLENSDVIIDMDVSVAHIDDASIGFICEHIDLDSISHLKRLVELNLGDENLLGRELLALIS